MKKLLILAILALSFSANAQWIQTNGPYGGQDVRCLAASGTNIFAGTMSGVFFSSNNGNTWTAVNNGLTNTYVRSLAISGTNIFAGTWSGVFLSNNNGSSWTNMNNGLPSNSVVMSLIVKDTNIFAGLYPDGGLGGVFRSGNNGSSWTEVDNGMPSYGDTMQSGYSIVGLGVNGNNIFAEPWRCKLAVSSNDGGSWAVSDNGFQDDPNGFLFTANDSDIFVGNSYGVFLSNNNGGLWTTMNNAFTTAGVSALAAFGNNIFAGASNEGVYLSTNNGILWTNESDNAIENQTITSFAMVGNVVFAGTSSNGVWKRALSEMTGIENNNNNNSTFNLYPNPSTGIFTISFSQPELVSGSQMLKQVQHDVSIYNVLGENIYTSPLTPLSNWRGAGGEVIDLSKQPAGVYFINIKTAEGTVIKKIIKE